MKSSFAGLAMLAGAAIAAPTMQKRADIDGTILNYALTLEHLEATFYAEGLKNFTEADFKKAGFTGANFYKNLMEVAYDEATHVSFLTSALKAAGVTPVAACTYDFGNLTPKTFIQTAVILEGVGVSAYLGAASLITDKDYLTAAGSILTVEARHNAFVRLAVAQSPFAQPFDTPLDFDEVYSLAAPFIVSCPSTNPTLPVKAFPTLAAEGVTGPVPQNSKLVFDVGCALPNKPLYLAFPLVTGPVFVPATPVKDGSNKVSARIPTGANGPSGESYAILTTSNSSLTDDDTVAGPAILPILVPYLA